MMLFTDKNPYLWDKSARFVTTPVLSLTLKDKNGTPLNITGLSDPVTIDIPTDDEETFETFYVQIPCNSRVAERHFLRTQVEQPPGQYLMLKFISNAWIYNISFGVQMDFTEKVTIEETKNGELLTDSPLIFLKEPQMTTVNWSVGLIPFVNDYNSCEQNTTVKISTKSITCRYWDNMAEVWNTDGCKVSPLTSDYQLQCYCNHLTSFAGGIFVLPNFIDPIAEAVLFLTFFDNPVIVMTVLVVWMMYFIALFWARRVDRQDFAKGCIETPPPSDPNDPFRYLMCVVTGWRWEAGTTAKISCYLQGTKTHSARHCLSTSSLSHSLFQSGSEDWFLITSKHDLGELQRIRVWHDNSGSSPSWFLSRILIHDLQNKQVYNFYYNNWLGEKTGCTKVSLNSISSDKLKALFKDQFILRTSEELRRDHMWISITCKPPRSNFTRAQRLSCALNFLLFTMLTCLMFHGIEGDDAVSADVSGFEFEISLTDIIIGIESSIIIFPVSLIILELFQRAEPKTSKSDRYIDLHKEDTRECVEKDPINSNKRREDTAKRKSYRMLPWWVVYIAWIIVFLSSVTATYFIMLYGLKYGYKESLEWMVSIVTATIDDLIFMEPIKCVVIAVILTFILRRPVKVQNQPVFLVQTDPLEEKYVQTRMTTTVHIPKHVPRKTLHKTREDHRLKMKLKRKVQDLAMYLLFVFVVLVVVHSHRPVETCFQQSKVVHDLFRKTSFEKINTHADFWTYLNDTVILTLSKTQSYNMKEKTPENDFLLLGAFRLRQVRVERENCKLSEEIRQLFIYKNDCFSSLTLLNDDTISYNNSWRLPIDKKSNIDEWTYQSAFDLESIPFIGQRSVYSGGGYVVEMKPDSSGTSKLSELIDESWIDTRTRAVFIEFTLFNPNVEMFSTILMAAEISNPGSITPTFQVFTSELFHHYESPREITLLILEIIFILVLLLHTYIEIKKIYQIGVKAYFKGYWNVLALLQIFSCYLLMSAYIKRCVVMVDTIEEYKSKSQGFANFSFAILWDMIVDVAMAFVVSTTIIKMIKMLMLNEKLNYIFTMINYAKQPLKAFVFMFIVVLLGFAWCGNLLFGAMFADFKSFVDSFLTLVQYTVRILNLDQYYETNSTLGLIFWFLYIFVFVFCFMNLFAAIVLNTVRTIRGKGFERKDRSKLLLNYMSGAFRKTIRLH